MLWPMTMVVLKMKWRMTTAKTTAVIIIFIISTAVEDDFPFPFKMFPFLDSDYSFYHKQNFSTSFMNFLSPFLAKVETMW